MGCMKNDAGFLKKTGWVEIQNEIGSKRKHGGKNSKNKDRGLVKLQSIRKKMRRWVFLWKFTSIWSAKRTWLESCLVLLKK